MTRYLVGGAVRDRLLGKDPSDRDWVVVGSSQDELQAAGYQVIVRKDDGGQLASFPVFLHPDTHEEHALARRSLTRTSDSADPWARFRNVTLEEDLASRDFTINAMAQTVDGRLIDPLDGERDLRDRLIRHVGEDFVEDPLRVIRGARFAAQLPGFTLAPETRDLFTLLARRGDLNALDPTRIWGEMFKAMSSPAPRRFIEVLRETQTLGTIFPEIEALFGVPQPAEHHPEIDTGVHTLLVLDQAAQISSDPRVRFAALVHDLGKALTPAKELPSHVAHEARGLDAFASLAQRMTIPERFKKVARVTIQHHLRCHRLSEAKASSVARLLRDLGAYRDPGIVTLFAQACEADARGRQGFENRDYPQADILKKAFDASSDVNGAMFIAQGQAPGPAIGQKVIAEQVRRIKHELGGSSPD